MRIGQVIGKAVMSKQDPAFGGARWLVVSPVATEHLNSACQTPPPVSDQPSLIVYDQLVPASTTSSDS